MDVYDIIADHYSDIFPLVPDKIPFIQSFLNKGDKFLDIGCATGDLCLELGRSGHTVYGIDLNARMIEIAKKKAQSENLHIKFKDMNMLTIADSFKRGFFTLITCFGNTLPHLNSPGEVRDFFNQVFVLLCNGGAFIFQILNYVRIMADCSVNFPVISKSGFIFKREYEFLGDRIRFIIKFETNKKKYTESTNLLPLKKQAILSMLKETGFNDIKCYTDYTLNSATGKEFSTLYVAKKK